MEKTENSDIIELSTRKSILRRRLIKKKKNMIEIDTYWFLRAITLDFRML